MIFKPSLSHLIFQGKKTQTRRLVKAGDVALPPWAPKYQSRERWRIGGEYAVQDGRGKKAVGRIRITAMRRERLQSISKADAVAEGLPEFRYWRLRFRCLWDSIQKEARHKWRANPEVWVLTFELVWGGDCLQGDAAWHRESAAAVRQEEADAARARPGA